MKGAVELSLKDSEIRYRRLFEAARDGILIMDPDTRKITDANPFMSELLGYSYPELLGKELWEIGLLKDEQASREAFRMLREKTFIRYEDLPLQTKAGQRRDVEFVSNVYDEDGRRVIQCNIRDITARKQMEAELRHAKDQLASLQTGDQSLQLQAAAAGVKQAQAAVAQAQNNIAQATASLDLIKLQQDKCTVTASIAGVISSRNLEAGEMAAAGGTVMVISQSNPVMLTVYVPEDRYGQVKLGQQVSITVDSFPGETFSGTVQYISNEAEFTPRDVQTVAGREATVYAVKINVPNDKLLLKSGMAADVTFK